MTCARNFRGAWSLQQGYAGLTGVMIQMREMIMGKLTSSQLRKRLDRTLEGLDPYQPWAKAIRKGLNQGEAYIAPASAHLGSKAGRLRRLPLFTDAAGKTRVLWPARKRRGRQAAALAQYNREQNYVACNNGRSGLTSAQRRRSGHKLNHALAKARRS